MSLSPCSPAGTPATPADRRRKRYGGAGQACHPKPKYEMGRTRFASGEDIVARRPHKTDFPVGQVRRYLEPGPIVLVSSRWRGKTNIMTMGWHTVMEFTPSLLGCVIA